MMERLGEWDHDEFKKIVAKVSNTEIMYKAVSFYLARMPLLLNDLLAGLSARIDPARVVKILQNEDNLPIARTWLISCQTKQNRVVNEALCDLFIEEEDHAALRDAVTQSEFPVNLRSLATRLASHDLLEFRRLAAYLYRTQREWTQSIDLSKQDRLWADALVTAATSQDTKVAEELLGYFTSVGMKDSVPAILYVCYEFIRPDVVEELSVS
jgi:clathrin heavy chain